MSAFRFQARAKTPGPPSNTKPIKKRVEAAVKHAANPLYYFSSLGALGDLGAKQIAPRVRIAYFRQRFPP
jgi:hypothetical protein